MDHEVRRSAFQEPHSISKTCVRGFIPAALFSNVVVPWLIIAKRAMQLMRWRHPCEPNAMQCSGADPAVRAPMEVCPLSRPLGKYSSAGGRSCISNVFHVNASVLNGSPIGSRELSTG